MNLLATTTAASVTASLLNAANPHATFSPDAISSYKGGCYTAPSLADVSASAARSQLTFTAAELVHAAGSPAIDWRDHGAVGPIQQQHPFGTVSCRVEDEDHWHTTQGDHHLTSSSTIISPLM